MGLAKESLYVKWIQASLYAQIFSLPGFGETDRSPPQVVDHMHAENREISVIHKLSHEVAVSLSLQYFRNVSIVCHHTD